MRSRLSALGTAAALLALTACSDHPPVATAPPSVPVAVQPAASAGGACILWDWAFLRQQLGVAFDVAGADQVDDTSSCVVRTADADYPTLALSVVESTDADAAMFREVLVPAKATAVKGLGKAAYRLDARATAAHGPSIEIGWLSEAEQLQTLTFTFPEGTGAGPVGDLRPRLVSLAKAMDTTNG